MQNTFNSIVFFLIEIAKSLKYNSLYLTLNYKNLIQIHNICYSNFGTKQKICKYHQLIFSMGNFFVINVIIFISILIVKVNSKPPEWSSWASCAESESCFRKRIITCDAGEGINCVTEMNGGNFRQDAYYCIESFECLENVEENFDAPEVSVLETHPLSFVIELNSPTVPYFRLSNRSDAARMCNNSTA